MPGSAGRRNAPTAPTAPATTRIAEGLAALEVLVGVAVTVAVGVAVVVALAVAVGVAVALGVAIVVAVAVVVAVATSRNTLRRSVSSACPFWLILLATSAHTPGADPARTAPALAA